MWKKGFPIFDLIQVSLSLFVYTLALVGPVNLFFALASESLLIDIQLFLVCYFLFLHSFVLSLGLARLLFQPKVEPGKLPIAVSKKYLSYAVNTAIEAVFFTAPFREHINIILYLKWIYFRLMGMKVASSALVGIGVTLRQLELLEIGENSTIGMECSMIAHMTLAGKYQMLDRIVVGKNCVIGGRSSLAPKTSVGDNSVIGARSVLFPGAQVGKNVTIGGSCVIDTGVRIPDNVKIKSHSFVTRSCKMKPGETWAGVPAAQVG